MAASICILNCFGDGAKIHQTGGFARIAKYVKDIKKQKENVLFFDGGDLLHGPALLVSTQGEVLLDAMQIMSLDGFVPGNWDFAYKKEQLVSLIKQLPLEKGMITFKGTPAIVSV